MFNFKLLCIMNEVFFPQYDSVGKRYFISLLNQFNISYRLTENPYDRVDIYFGNSSVGEIKYRTKSYDEYIIQEDKFQALKKVRCVDKYYITVVDNDIYMWKTSTIKNYIPVKVSLPVEDDVYVDKMVRYLPIEAADLHFHFEDSKWVLKNLNF